MKRLVDILLDEVSVVTAGANNLADIVLIKNEEGNMPKKETPAVEETAVDKVEDIVTDAQEEIKEEVAEEVPEVAKADDEVAEEVTEKADTLDVEKKLTELEKRAAEAEMELAKMRDEKAELAWVSKCTEVAQDGETVGKLLHQVAKMDSAVADSIFDVVKALSAQVAESKLFGVVGKSGEDTTDAYTKLKKKAQELQGSKGISFEKAFTQVCNENLDLVAEYRSGK